ncbi:MAG: hypothetical protein QOE13_3365 [Gaiellaceae bacterium]|nr:hypothetical protein [Gaiellaceae bacterium]
MPASTFPTTTGTLLLIAQSGSEARPLTRVASRDFKSLKSRDQVVVFFENAAGSLALDCARSGANSFCGRPRTTGNGTIAHTTQRWSSETS